MSVIEKLDLYAELQRKYDDKFEVFSELNKPLTENIARLAGEIKQEVIESGQSVSGHAMTALFCKGKVSWDAKILEGYSVAHPEIRAARKEGKPYVTFRKVEKS